ncbi:phosphatase PAP2 family protein [Streptomyces swartbergensis]|uniref:phosphatase PAP2 family protein n=1 Tax=Streptomyces swartbergensis TaxID=487165 RepID=UPI003824A373
MAMAQLAANGVCKQMADRPRPPKEWIPHDEVEDRPDSSSFPSGHTAAAVAFTAAITPAWPLAGGLCVVPIAMVAVERVHSGAHYPSDVAVGTAIGLASALLIHRIPHLLRRRACRGASLPKCTSATGRRISSTFLRLHRERSLRVVRPTPNSVRSADI